MAGNYLTFARANHCFYTAARAFSYSAQRSSGAKIATFRLRFLHHYFATATASSNLTDKSFEIPSAPIVTP